MTYPNITYRNLRRDMHKTYTAESLFLFITLSFMVIDMLLDIVENSLARYGLD